MIIKYPATIIIIIVIINVIYPNQSIPVKEISETHNNSLQSDNLFKLANQPIASAQPTGVFPSFLSLVLINIIG